MTPPPHRSPVSPSQGDPHPAPGAIVYVDWRDERYSPEPGKIRPGIVISDAARVPASLGILTVIPLTGDARLAPSALSVRIEPGPENGLKKPSFALAWNVQSVAIQRIKTTTAKITTAELDAIKTRIVECLAL